MPKRKPSDERELGPFDSFISQINLNDVADAILAVEDGQPALALGDFEEAKQCVWEAAEKWLVRDIHDLEIMGVEEKFTRAFPIYNSPRQFRGIKDLKGRIRGTVSTTREYAGKLAVFDWKTATNLDVNWRDRMVDSWQWRIYLTDEPEAEVFVYRGITRPHRKDPTLQFPEGRWECDTREIFITRPATNDEEVLIQVTNVTLEQRALINAGLGVWTRKQPSACGAYGRDCPFREDCRAYSMPHYTPLERELSYSSMDRFMQCPEKFRRMECAPAGSDDTDASQFGQAVHRGLANLYEQVRKVFQTD